MHLVSNVLRLATDEFLLFSLDIVLFLAIVGHCQLIHILNKLLLHASLQRIEAIGEEVVA